MSVQLKNSKELASGVEGLIEEGEAFRRLNADAVSAPRAKPVRSARVFHTAMAVAMLVTTFAGFAPTYFLKAVTDKPPLSPILHVHGVVFSGWLVLLVAQSGLVAAHRVDWHRRLGIAGALLALTMVPLGMMVGIEGARGGPTLARPDPLAFLIFPMGQSLMFGGIVAAAIWKRRQPEIHRRLILLATAVLITPAISRLPFVGHPILALGITVLFVVAGMIHDYRSRGRVHRIYVIGAVAILLSGPMRFAASQSAAWHSFARLLVG